MLNPGENVNKTSSRESSLTQCEIKDNEVETSAECFDNCLLEDLTYGNNDPLYLQCLQCLHCPSLPSMFVSALAEGRTMSFASLFSDAIHSLIFC